MKTKTLVATALLLLLPLSYSVLTLAVGSAEVKTTTSSGITWFWTKTTTNILNGEQSEFKVISPEWFKDGDYFDTYFGGGVWIYVILALIIATIAVAITKEDLIVAPIILIIASILIFYLRSQELADRDLGWVKKTESFGTTVSYFEVPIAPLASVIVAILDFRKK